MVKILPGIIESESRSSETYHRLQYLADPQQEADLRLRWWVRLVYKVSQQVPQLCRLQAKAPLCWNTSRFWARSDPSDDFRPLWKQHDFLPTRWAESISKDPYEVPLAEWTATSESGATWSEKETKGVTHKEWRLSQKPVPSTAITSFSIQQNYLRQHESCY